MRIGSRYEIEWFQGVERAAAAPARHGLIHKTGFLGAIRAAVAWHRWQIAIILSAMTRFIFQRVAPLRSAVETGSA